MRTNSWIGCAGSDERTVSAVAVPVRFPSLR